jgi:hypothetical protein
LAGGDRAAPGQVRIQESLVVAQVQVGLAAIVGDEDFAMLMVSQIAWIYIEIGVELLDRDGEAARLEDSADGRSSDPLTDGAHYPARDEDVLRHSIQLAAPVGAAHQTY